MYCLPTTREPGDRAGGGDKAEDIGEMNPGGDVNTVADSGVNSGGEYHETSTLDAFT
jgi:hypothetical protein